ncbi:TolC family protein [Flavobacterium sp. 20NA77.7]|uniref:TolC family protein n=1 Tax=Flavobacterium nakdongensis TaxID=3073563 RepID=A0ABY9R924_9FLAO|nr:TolC family protein [Flavobacterium sp. 20NA77.7]WMW77085.1 TolC family protein [Flavobacterium sp. 20NA77.7]
MKKIILYFFCLCCYTITAQELLTLEQAVTIALENNYAIKIAKNEAKVGEINNAIGNAGMLPNVSATFTKNNSILNTTQTQSGGTERTLDGAKNMNMTYGVGLDWTLFDGMRMFARKERFENLEKQGEANLKRIIFTKISTIYQLYYDLVQQQNQLKAVDTAIVISKERVTLLKNKFSIGKVSKLEVLNSEVDLQADESLKIQLQNNYQATKIKLNELLARDLKLDFYVANEFTYDKSWNYEELQAQAEKQNPELQAQIIAKKLADINLKEIKGTRYPTIRVTSGYNFTRSEASLGFVTQSTGNGFVYGINASLPLFNGNNQNRNEKTAKLIIENAQFALEQLKQTIKMQLTIAFENYQAQLKLVNLEEKNVTLAKQNLDITLAKYKIGTLTPIELRTAQQNYVDVLVRFSNAQYLTKIAEINLKELAGIINWQ